MLNAVNLGLTGFCNANCRFCPRDKNIGDTKYMPMELIDKIYKEMSSDSFKKKHQIGMMQIGENCEATLHPELLPILRKIRFLTPKVSLFSNFSNMTKVKSAVIIREKLIDSIHTNIDGENEESYFFMKQLSFKNFIKNVLDFLSIEPRDGIEFYIHILPAYKYKDLVTIHFGSPPKGMEGSFDRYEGQRILDYWKSYLKEGDNISIEGAFFWNETDKPKLKGNFSCPQLHRMDEAFIAPNGDWYLCCFDSAQKLVIGNVYEQTIDEIYNGDRRKELIYLLQNKQFDQIGSPCNRVDCCQVRY